MAITKENIEMKILGLDKVVADSRELARSLSRTIAHYATEKLTEKAKETLAVYYEDYDPLEYSWYNNNERTYQLLNNSAKRFYDNSSRFACIGGVRITSEDLFYPNKGADASKTVDSFLSGWHGGWCEMQNGYKPRRVIKDYARELVKNICTIDSNVLIDQAFSSAKLSVLKRG